jgi:hypothetical protein
LKGDTPFTIYNSVSADLHGLGVFDRYNEIRMDISVFPGFRRCKRFAFAEEVEE